MGDKSAIEWTEATWNPVTGCDQVSEGCGLPRPGDETHGTCYALTLAARLKAMGNPRYQRDGDPRTSGPGFGVTLHGDQLDLPLRWRKPRRIFTNSMSDLFHDQVPDEFIADVFATMAMARQHTFQVLTKRPGRMASLLSSPRFPRLVGLSIIRAAGWKGVMRDPTDARWVVPQTWPLRNVWLGVSVESQKWAGVRVPLLLRTPAAVRFLSCEPLLGPLPSLDLTGIDWMIVGGESGPGARPMHPQWARDLRDQCRAAGVAYFFKQWGRWRPINEQAEMPSGIGCPVFDLSGTEVDFRGHGTNWWPGFAAARERGWQMFHAAGQRAAGRELDGREWSEYPRKAAR